MQNLQSQKLIYAIVAAASIGLSNPIAAMGIAPELYAKALITI
jgi:hypothetical protein